VRKGEEEIVIKVDTQVDKGNEGGESYLQGKEA
jgi:hypothetical protein